MVADFHAVRITCPTCNKVHVVDIPSSISIHGPDTGLYSVSLKASCGHTCMVFIDKSFRMRGGQCADYEVETVDVNQADGINVTSLGEEAYHMTDLVLKFAAEIIKMNAQDAKLFKTINAGDKIKSVEIALIHCDLRKAGDILSSLRDFSTQIGEIDLGERILQKIQKINNLIINKPGFDWNAIILEDSNADDEVEFGRRKAIHYERIRKIMAELEYEAISGTIDRELVEAKKQQLMEIVDDL